MKLYHTTPCHECPWRKSSVKGYLGGHGAEYYADAVDANEVPACHMKEHGPESNKTAMCAGSLAVMSNQCKSAYGTTNGDEARLKVGKREDCFKNIFDFYEYHTNETYVPYFVRMLRGSNS